MPNATIPLLTGLAYGIRPGLTDTSLDGSLWLPIHFAAVSGNVEFLALCLHLMNGQKRHQKSAQGQTPLHLAVIYNHPLSIQHLLAFEADVNERDNHGMTPLMYACLLGHKSVVELLFLSRPNTLFKNTQGKTARKIAQGKGFTDIAEHPQWETLMKMALEEKKQG